MESSSRPIDEITEGPHRATIYAITAPDGPDMGRLYDVFLRIFPHRRADAAILPLYTGPIETPSATLINHAWLVEIDQQVVGLRLFSYLPQRNIGHGAFVGLLPQARGLGLASWLVRCTLRQLTLDAEAMQLPQPLGYCAEVERVSDAHTTSDLRQRIASQHFHETNGALHLPVEYQEPTVPIGSTENQGRPMDLMWYPLAASHLAYAQLRMIVEALYYDIYRLPANAPLVQRVIQTLQP